MVRRDAIEEHIRALDRRLIGPARLKSGLLLEARHGLEDAAAAYQDEGLDPGAARVRAVGEFGDAADLAPAFQAELAAAAARRLAALIAVTTVVAGLGSTLMWQGAPWTGPQPPGSYLVLTDSLDWIGRAVTGLALLGVLALGWVARRPGRLTPGMVRTVAVGGLGALAALAIPGGVIYAYSVSLWHGAATWPPMIVGGLVLSATYAWLARCAAQCLAAARRLALEG